MFIYANEVSRNASFAKSDDLITWRLATLADYFMQSWLHYMMNSTAVWRALMHTLDEQAAQL